MPHSVDDRAVTVSVQKVPDDVSERFKSLGGSKLEPS